MNKIGFFSCSVGWGGLEMNVLKLAHWLYKRGWELTLYTNENSRIYLESKKYSIKTHVIPNHRKYFDFLGAYRFYRMLKKHKIDNIFVFDNRDLDFIYLTKLFSFGKLKVVYQQHMQIGLNKKDILHTMRFSGIDHWIAPLNFLKNEVRERTRLDPAKIEVIPLGTEVNEFILPKYQKSEARHKLNIDPSVFLLGILGRIDPKKGQYFLVEAIRALNNKSINAELLIMGEPTINEPESYQYFVALKQYLIEHNLSDKVHIRNYTSDISLFYNAIDVFILASEGETYGMVTIEAMLSRLPVIATNSGGTPEILNFGELGLLYIWNDLDNFCEKVSWILQNQEASDLMATKAQKVASEKFSHNHECELIEKLFEKAPAELI
ncbi:MAG TPA: glycosyltransferase family 4 protein [Bacteroidales bacterium]